MPYVVALFSAMLWIYYALLKSNELLLITINSAGCVIETLYIAMYLLYAPKKAKVRRRRRASHSSCFGPAGINSAGHAKLIHAHASVLTHARAYVYMQLFTAKILLLLNVGVFGLILLLTLLLSAGQRRVVVLGWVCVAFSVSVFVAPLSIIVRKKQSLISQASLFF